MVGFPLGLLSQGGGAGSGADYELIQTISLGSDISSVTFSSISSAYKHLEFRIVARSTNAAQLDNLSMQINGDSSALYSTHSLYAYSSTVTGSQSTANTYFYWPSQLFAASNISNTFSTGTMQILNYTGSTYKTMRSFFGASSTTASNSRISQASALYRSTSAVSSVSFVCSANIKAGSRISLYGIRG